MSKLNYYTVWVGRSPGIYSSWEECEAQVIGFERAVFKGFATYDEAKIAYEKGSQFYIGTKENKNDRIRFSEKRPLDNSLCVDGAYSGRTGFMEYQGVLFPNKLRVFKAGPFSSGTNNIAEFLAIVHAMTICKDHPEIPAIYSDSQTAIKWVNDRKANTLLEVDSKSNQVLNLVERAEKWLNNNVVNVPLLKWETSAWGENPADFGRK